MGLRRLSANWPKAQPRGANRRWWTSIATLFPALTLVAVGLAPTPVAAGAGVAVAVQDAAAQFNVPYPVLMAWAYTQTQLAVPNQPTIAGGEGLMALTPTQVEAGAALTGADPALVRTDVAAGARAAAADLAHAQGSGPLASGNWRSALSTLAGPLVTQEIASYVASGFSLTLRSGEPVVLPPQPMGAQPRFAVPANTDYGPAIWYPANPSNYSVANRPLSDPIDMIVVHVVQGSCAAAAQVFQRSGYAASAHYIVCDNGTVYQSVREKDIAWHAGNWAYNVRSIGIENEGYVGNAFPDSLYRASAKVAAHVCETYGVPLDRNHVIGHNQVPDPNHPGLFGGIDHHTDPGPTWNWGAYLGYAQQDAAQDTSPARPVFQATATATDGSASIAWSAAPACAIPITGYVVTVQPGGRTVNLPPTATFATVSGLTDGVSYTLSVTAQNRFGSSVLVAAPSVTPLPIVRTQAEPFHPMTPQRIFDTRTGSGFGINNRIGPGQSMTVQVAGAHGVPSNATAAVLNVGVTDATGAASDFVLLYPSDQARPNASTINFLAGATVANLTQVALSATGQVTVYNSVGWVDVFLDLSGYYGASSGPGLGLYNSLPSPVRVLDTRTNLGGHPGPLQGGDTLSVRVAGVQGVPADAESVVLNLTEVGGTAASFLATWPDQTTYPGVSNLNFSAGRAQANRVIVKIGSDGDITITNSVGSAGVLVDLAGWFTGGTAGDTTGQLFSAQTPTRIFDSRIGQGHSGPIGPGQFVPVTAPAGVTGSLSANVTVLDGSTNSYLGVYPTSGASGTSDINFLAEEILANLVVTRISGGAFVIYNSVGSADVLIDVNGEYS